MKKLLGRIILFGSIFFAVHCIIIIAFGLSQKECSTHTGIVLGNKVNEDGTVSKRLKARLDKTVQLYHNGKIKLIITSGGLGKEGHWEGTVMKDYLVKNNIPSSAIIVDDFGNDTEASVSNGKRICDSLQQKEIMIISQYFHLARCNMLFRKAGFETTCTASPFYFEWRDPYSILREFAGFYTQLF